MSTHIKISTITVGAGGAASIDFTSIPATYTDLKFVLSLRSTAAVNAIEVILNFNSNTTGFTAKQIYGEGVNALSTSPTTRTGGFTIGTSGTASVFSNTELYIPNYTSANYKSYSVDTVMENNIIGAYSALIAGLWSNTSAITSIGFSPSSGNFAQYSSATLYGIKSS